MTFYKLGIKSELVYALETQSITTPTPIQAMAIPNILQGSDILAEAQTGTGKTFAFLLPIFQNIDLDAEVLGAIILAPTRELAIQITAVATTLTEIKPLRVLAAYGGQDINAQLHRFKSSPHIIVATPGRLLDHMRRGTFTFDALKYLVIDEADQMFQIGFKLDVEAIVKALPKSRQTLCFSATLSDDVTRFANRFCKTPLQISAPKAQIVIESIEQYVVISSGRKKFQDFQTLLTKCQPENAMVFCRSRAGAHSLYEEMAAAGYNVGELHGALTQAKREHVMQDFRKGLIQYLVATDVASRGLDISGLSHVFNYNLPDDVESYVHRIGRTGRAGKSGIAYTILTEKDVKRMAAIEAFISMSIPRIRMSAPASEDTTASASPQQNNPKRHRGFGENRSNTSAHKSKSSNRPSGKHASGKRYARNDESTAADVQNPSRGPQKSTDKRNSKHQSAGQAKRNSTDPAKGSGTDPAKRHGVTSSKPKGAAQSHTTGSKSGSQHKPTKRSR